MDRDLIFIHVVAGTSAQTFTNYFQLFRERLVVQGGSQVAIRQLVRREIDLHQISLLDGFENLGHGYIGKFKAQLLNSTQIPREVFLLGQVVSFSKMPLCRAKRTP